MQFRRSMMFTMALLLLAGVTASMVGSARADVIKAKVAGDLYWKARAHSAKLGTSNVFDPDTVYIGHVVGNTGLPGVAGGYGPWHIGRGGYRPQTGGVATNNGFWDFDRFNPGETDTLQGWWSLQTPFQSVGGSNLPDFQRPMFCLDFGNTGNYRGNDTQKKTFGVLGYWHRDNGTALTSSIGGTNPVAPGWSPLAGSFSAWCGLRSHGDLSAVDPITGNAFNTEIISREGDNHQIQVGSVAGAANLTDANYPGYGSQWDQMLYRDFAHTTGQNMVVTFKYTTKMSDGADTDVHHRSGWFDKDPLLPTGFGSYVADGNFISSSLAGTNAPVDSFMVYIGVPTNEGVNGCVYSDGINRTIYDKQRRWFSEVVRVDQPYHELLSTWGTTVGTQAPSFTIPAATLDAMGSTIRVVFRIKTNRGFDDEDSFASGFSSGGSGAAILDDVSVKDGVNAANVTGFELAGDIDNALATASTAAWKSTGKPPGVYYHWHNLLGGAPGGYISGLPYADPCGPIGGIGRICNMAGNVVTPGQHDVAGERPGGQYGANDQDRLGWIMSPTINLMSTGNGPGFYNDTGIDQEIAIVTSEIQIFGDFYVNLLQFGFTGNGARGGFQTYPGIQAGNGVRTWATPVKTIGFNSFDGNFGCYRIPGFFVPLAGTDGLGEGTYLTTNANGVADSVRIFYENTQICFRRPVTPASCSPSSGPNVGFYLDNISLGLIDGAAPPGISNLEWDLWNDAFPTNSDNSFVGSPAFDTLAANIRSGWNSSPNTASLARNEIPGDSMQVKAPGANVRVDLVFRILPGPGNYVTPPTGVQKIGQLKKRPDQAAAATAGDGSFWGSYLADVGLFGSNPPHTSATTMSAAGGYGVAANAWDPNIWVSARCDTAELNLFPCQAVGANVSDLQSGLYQTTLHEDDVNPTLTRSSAPLYGGGRAALGIQKNRCILISTLTGDPVDETNIDCGAGTVPPSGTSYATAWATKYVPAIGGYSDPTCPACPVGQTKEYTKIMPDGQLTAGSHVEYFFRKTFVGNLSAFETYPDTTLIFPQNTGDQDGKRWGFANVLPDRWKDTNFGGAGMACMLYANCASARAEALVFDNMAQTIGLTASSRRGAGTGYYVGATQDFPGDITGLLPGQQVSLNLGQTGTLFDQYNVIAGDSNVPAGRLGSRYAGAAAGLSVGKTSTDGPTKLMLKTYYRHLFLDAADIVTQLWGPITDETSDDIGVLSDYMSDNTGSTTPRTVIGIGRDLAAMENTDHPSFLPTFFGANFRDNDYRNFASNPNDVADLIPIAPLSSTGAIYGVFSPCTYQNDVLNVNTAVPGAAPAVLYENVSGGPYYAGIYAPAGGTRLANTLLLGWTFGLFGQQGSRYTLSRGGHHVFWLNALTGLIGSVCGQPLSAPSGVGDNLGSNGAAFVNFMNLRSENPMRTGEARIAFGLTKTEKVDVKVYDVTGRLVKTVANRVFPGGQEHIVTWDGTNEQGQPVARGVYFYQLRSPSFVSEKKLTVLKD